MSCHIPYLKTLQIVLALLPSCVLAQTTLLPGDLLIVGVSTNIGPCGGVGGEDLISFVAFRDIETGTTIDFTDNGWQRGTPGLWGNTEGFVRMTRTGGTIPAGTVIQVQLPTLIADPYQAVQPDAAWNFTPLSSGPFPVNLGAAGDQLYFMQGGNWVEGTVGNHDAAYVGGNILFAYNMKGTWVGVDSPEESGLHPDVTPCFHVQSAGPVREFSSYSGPSSPATQLEWISRVGNDPAWTDYADCASYVNPGPTIPIAPSQISISCTFCAGCATLSDTIQFNLPASGGPFQSELLAGTDTLTRANLTDGSLFPVMLDSSITYSLLSVTDANGCPVYTDLGPPQTIAVSPVTGPDSLLVDTCLVFPATFDLTSLEDSLTGGSGLPVRWFTDPGLNTAIGQPGQFPVASGTQRLYADYSIPSCSSPPVPVILSINPQPVVNPLTINICAIPGNPAVIDLNTISPQVSPGLQGRLQFSELGMVGIDTLLPQYSFLPDTVRLEVVALSDAGCNAGPGLVTLARRDAPDPAGFSLNANPATGCAPLSTQISLSAPDAAPYVLDFFLDDSLITGQVVLPGASLPVTLPASATIVLDRVESTNGCASSFASNPDTLRVNVLEGVELEPDLVLQACEGIPVDLNSGVRLGTGTDPLTQVTFHAANPPTPGNELASALVTVDQDTVFYALGVNSLGCSDTLVLPVVLDPSLFRLSTFTADVFNGFEVSCAGGNNGSAGLTISGGTPPYSINWSNGATGFTATDLSEGAYTVVVTDGNGCIQTDTLTITAPDPIQADFGIPIQRCGFTGGTDIVLNTASGGVGNYSFSLTGVNFSPIDQLPFTIEALPPGEQTIQLRDENGCVLSTTLDVPEPITDLTLDLPGRFSILSGESVTLEALANFTPLQLFWATDSFLIDTSSLSITVSPIVTTTYVLTVLSVEGCVLQESVTVEVDQDRKVYLPTAFSPNNDGANDFYFPLTEATNLIENFQVFDRWGGLIFERQNVSPADNLNLGWDGNFKGRTMSPGVYVYKVEVRFPDGISEIFSGEFTLVR